MYAPMPSWLPMSKSVQIFRMIQRGNGADLAFEAGARKSLRFPLYCCRPLTAGVRSSQCHVPSPIPALPLGRIPGGFSFSILFADNGGRRVFQVGNFWEKKMGVLSQRPHLFFFTGGLPLRRGEPKK